MAPDGINSLGEFLRNEREKKGVTIEQVASATKISVRILHLIEGNQFSELPAKPFIRGFVASYARFIGLDPTDVLNRFDDYIDQRVTERPTRDAGHTGYAFEKREGDQSRTLLWIVMGSFVFLGGVLIFFLKPTLHHRKKSHLDELRTVVTEASPGPSGTPERPAFVGPLQPGVLPYSSPAASPTPVASATVVAEAPPPAPVASPVLQAIPPVTPSHGPLVQAPSPKPTPTAKPTAAPTPAPSASAKPDPLNSGADYGPKDWKHKIIFKAIGDVWVRFKVDEKPVMRFILRANRILVLKGKKLVRFQVSDPAAITFNWNNAGEKVLSAEPSVAEHNGNATLIFPREMSEKVGEPFPGEKPLSKEVPASPRGQSTPSTGEH